MYVWRITLRFGADLGLRILRLLTLPLATGEETRRAMSERVGSRCSSTCKSASICRLSTANTVFADPSAVNRNVGGSNPPRGANSLFMQRVASIFRKLCALAMKCQVHESRLISINEDEGKSTRACVFEVDQLNRDQPRSIALKPSIRLATECRRLAQGANASFSNFISVSSSCASLRSVFCFLTRSTEFIFAAGIPRRRATLHPRCQD